MAFPIVIEYNNGILQLHTYTIYATGLSQSCLKKLHRQSLLTSLRVQNTLIFLPYKVTHSCYSNDTLPVSTLSRVQPQNCLHGLNPQHQRVPIQADHAVGGG